MIRCKILLKVHAILLKVHVEKFSLERIETQLLVRLTDGYHIMFVQCEDKYTIFTVITN